MKGDALKYLSTLEEAGVARDVLTYGTRTLAALEGGGRKPVARTALGKAVIEHVSALYAKDYKVPARYSLTFMEKAENCLLGARLSREHDYPGPFATLGHVVHDLIGKLTMDLYAEGQSSFTADEARERAEVYMGTPDEMTPLSLEHYRKALDMTEHWARTDSIWPDADLFLTEQLLTRELGGHTFSGRIDRIEVKGAYCRIRDYKTGYKVPDQEAFEQRLQSPFYSWLADAAYDLSTVEVFDIGELYVRFGSVRTCEFEREQLKIDRYLKAAGQRIETAYASGEFPATPGEWCDNCSLPHVCPHVLSGSNDHAAITTTEDAEAVLGAVVASEAAVKEAKNSLKAFVKRTDTPVHVNGKVAKFVGKTVRSKDPMVEWVTEHGGDPDALVTERTTPEFRIQKGGPE